MANYSAKIDVILSGLRELSILEDRLEKIGGIIEKLNKTPVALNVGGRGAERDLSGKLSKEVNDYVREWVNGNKQIGKSINAVQQQTEAFRELLRDTAMVQQDPAQKNAVKNLATAWADSTKAASQYEKTLNDIQRAALGLQPQSVRDFEVARRETFVQNERRRRAGEAGAAQDTKNANATFLNNVANWTDFFATAAKAAVDVKANALNTKASWNDFFSTAAQYAVNVKANALNTKASWTNFFDTAAQYAVNVKANALNTRASWNDFFSTAAQYAVNVKAKALNTKASWANFFDTAAQYAVNVKANALNTKASWNNFFDTAAQYAVNVKANALNTKASWTTFFNEAAKVAQDLTARTRQLEGEASAAARQRLAADQERRRGGGGGGGGGRGGGGGGGGGGGDGRLSFNPNPTQENLALGAGFPLLFGGGPAQVAGGLVGSMFGSGFGGQILGAALAQQLSDALARIKEIGDATKTLNMDNLRTSAVYVNSELETTVRLLVESGKAEEALAYTAKEVAEQLGTTPEVLADINAATNALTTEWDRFIGLLSTNLATIAAPLVVALTAALGVLNGLLEAANKFNALWTGALKRAVDAVIDKFPPLRDLVDNIALAFNGMTEEQQKLAAALSQDIDKSMASLKVKKEILDLEKQRTKGFTQRDRLADIEIDKLQKLKQIEAEAAQEKIDLQNKYKDLVGTPEYAQLAVKLKQVDAAKKQNIAELELNTQRKVGLELLNKMYTAQEENLNSLKQQQRYKDAEIATYTAIGSVVGARIGAEQQLVSLKKAQLEWDYGLAKTAQERYNIAILIFKQDAEAAALQYQQTLASIAIEVERNKLQVDRNVLKGYEILAEGKLQILQSKTAEEEAKKKLALQDALNAQNMVIQGSVQQLASSKLIAQAQSEAAGYQYKAGILAAGTALQQKLVSDEIGLTNVQAANLSAGMVNAYSSTSAMNNIASNLSTKLGVAAQDIQASQTAALATTTQFSTASIEATQRHEEWRASVLASNAAQDEAARKEAAVAQAAQQAAATRIAELQRVIAAARAGDKAMVDSNGFTTKTLQSNWAMLLGYIQGLYRKFLSGLLGGVNNAIRAINSVISKYNSLPTPPFPDVPQLGYLQIPAFAAGGLVTGPTLAMVGEGGESEYIIPESKMARASANYLAGGRGAGIMEGGGGGGSAPSINITTGPVVEFNGERYVTMRDMERGLQQMATSIYSGLRTPAGRYATGVR